MACPAYFYNKIVQNTNNNKKVFDKKYQDNIRKSRSSAF